MAKQRFGVNDAYRGTVGTVIGYEWRGRWCLRARPLHVRNPRTAKQQSNRQRFRQMVDLASHMKFALRKGLRGVSLGMHVTECNLFVKSNKECFSLDAEGRMAVDWERLIVSEGEVAVPGFTGTVLMDTRLMDTALMDTPLSQPQAAASSPNLGEQLNGKGRGELPTERWQGKEIHFYGFAVDEKGAASDTVYIGALSPMETRQASSLQGEMSVETDFPMREYTKNFSSTTFNKKRFIYYKYVDEPALGFAPPKESSASTQNPFYQPLRVDKKFFAG